MRTRIRVMEMPLFAWIYMVWLFGGIFVAAAVMWIVPIIWPKFRRPYLKGWAILTITAGSSLAIDHLLVQDGSLLGAFGVFLAVAIGSALVVALMWLRMYQTELAYERAEEEQILERFRRYRPKVFSE